MEQFLSFLTSKTLVQNLGMSSNLKIRQSVRVAEGF